MIWGDSQLELIRQLNIGNYLGFILSIVGLVYADLMVRYMDHQKINTLDIEPNNKKSDFIDESSMNAHSIDIFNESDEISNKATDIDSDNFMSKFDPEEIIRSKVIKQEKETLEVEK